MISQKEQKRLKTMRMTYDKAPSQGVELWREDTQKRDSGGYNLKIDGLPVG